MSFTKFVIDSNILMNSKTPIMRLTFCLNFGIF